MERPVLDAAPDTLDSWLRQHLGRSLVVIGMSLPVTVSRPGGAVVLGAPPVDYVRALEEYEELAPRWLAAGTLVDQALTHAALHEADVLLLWLADAPADARPAPLVAFLDHAEAAGAREEAVIALVGPGASHELAHRLGFDDGFAPADPPGEVVSRLAHEVLALEELRRKGSSPPCYL
jgi:beta-lysine 5,6-aminomutase beta subunit